MKKKLLSFILMMGLLISSVTILPVEVLAATDVSYVDESGNIKTVTATEFTGGSTLNTGWYVIQEDVNQSGTIKVEGDVDLILADGKILDVEGNANLPGIQVTEGNSLTIYGQEEGTGKLKATSGGDNATGIGGHYNPSRGGTITINGGTVIATGGKDAAGIGGGQSGHGGTITINKGTVTATGGINGAGIGSGNTPREKGTITINGGMVTATGGRTVHHSSPGGGAGIGGGYQSKGDTINITGGRVTATGGSAHGSGLGGGYFSNGGNVHISGGMVTAKSGGAGGAGIGTSNNGTPGNINITGGTVFILGGSSAKDVYGSSFTISDSAAVFLRSDNTTGVETTTHRHKEFTDHVGNTPVYGIPASWDGDFGAWLRLSTMSFNSAGGNQVADITQIYGTAITPPADPTREGYAFDGWSPVLPDIMPNNDLNLTARWKINAPANEETEADITEPDITEPDIIELDVRKTDSTKTTDPIVTETMEKLPATGETDSFFLTGIALSLIGAGLLVLFVNRKVKKDKS